MLAVAAAVAAVVVAEGVFPYLSTNSDEGVYLAQAEALADGHLLSPAPDVLPQAYQPWFSAIADGEYAYKYTPVHGAFLAVSIAASGSALPALGLLAALDVVLVALLVRALGASHRAGLLAGALLALSPAFFILSGTHLPYLSNLALLVGFALAVVRGLDHRRVGWFLLAGACLAAAVFGRQYDAVLFGVPVLGLVVVRWWARHRGHILSAFAWIGAGAVPVLALFLAFNTRATGSAFDLPFTLLDANDSIGFGPRRVVGTDPLVDYTPKIAAQSTVRWLVLVAATTAGGLPLLVAATIGVVRDRRMPGGTLLGVLAAVWVVGYGLFWGIYAAAFLWNGANYLGPFYHLPLVAVTVAAGAIALDRLAPRSPRFSRAAAVAMVALTFIASVAVVDPNLDRTERRRQVAEATAAGLPDDDEAQLVLLPPLRGPFLQHPFPWLRNQPDIGGDTVYAVHDPSRDAEVIEAWAGHTPYLVSVPGGYDDAQQVPPSVHVAAQEVVAGPALALRVEAREGAGAVRFGFAGATLSPVPAPDGSVRVWLSTRDGRLVVTDETGRVVAERASDAGSVALHIAQDRPGALPTEYAVPVRVTGGEIDVMVPGELVSSGEPVRPLEIHAEAIDPEAVP